MAADTDARLTLSVVDMPLVVFARIVADRAGVSVAIDSSLDSRPVSVDVADVPVGDVLAVVARRLNVQVARTGDLFFVGSLRPEDRGVLVRRVTRLAQGEAEAAIAAILSNDGQARSLPGGLVVVSDRVEVLSRVDDMLNRIEAAPIESWVVQLLMIAISDEDSSTWGVDVAPAADVALTLARASAGDWTQALSVNAALNAVLRAERTTDRIRLEASPLFLMLDGSTARHQDGTSVPIAKRSTSETGVTTTSEYQMIDTGLIVSVGLRDVGRESARLTVEAEVSEIIGYVANEAPIIRRSTFAAEPMIRSGGVYLIGSLKQDRASRGTDGPASLVHRRIATHHTWQVWARVYKVAGPPALAD